MGDQASLIANHVGLSTLPDLDLRNDIGDQLQIDLGDGHAVLGPVPGLCHAHVGFGLIAEIDRTVVDLMHHRLDKTRIIGEIGLAADHVPGQT